MALLALDARMRIQDFGQILLARFKHTCAAHRERVRTALAVLGSVPQRLSSPAKKLALKVEQIAHSGCATSTGVAGRASTEAGLELV